VRGGSRGHSRKPVSAPPDAASFDTVTAAEQALTGLRIGFSGVDASISLAVGQAWRAYRRADGTRERVIADFLVGAHAVACADRLLARDRGFYRSCFAALPILDPSNEPR
jgi:predicted nucleic acid-binding protein